MKVDTSLTPSNHNQVSVNDQPPAEHTRPQRDISRVDYKRLARGFVIRANKISIESDAPRSVEEAKASPD